MAISFLHEIATTRFWQMHQASWASYRDIVQRNIDLRAAFVPGDKHDMMPYRMKASDRFLSKTYVGDAESVEWRNNLDPEDSIINVCQIVGPILRNGDACTYGSIDNRNQLVIAADSPYVVGHIIYINTPGGSSDAKYDFEDAFSYIRSKGQKIIALVDGMCCSAGEAVAAMCDEVHYVNPNHIIGCIGTYSAGFTLKDGDENSISKERYFEVYATYCPDKNKAYRDVAKGDYTQINEEALKANMEFVNMVRKYRPQATEDQLTGKEYKCGDVIGTLVDRQSTLAQTAERIMELAGLSMPQGDNSLSAPPSSNNNNGDDDDSDDACHPINKKDTSSSSRPNKITHQSNNQSAMKEYPKIQSALGIEALVAGRDQSVYLDKSLAEQLETTLEEQQQWKTALDAKIQENQQLSGSLSKLRQDSAAQLASLTESHSAALSALEDTHAGELATLNATHATALTDANALLTAANATIEEQKGTIEELAAGPGTGEQVTGKPQDNNGAQATANDPCVCKEGMTLAEKADATAKRERDLQRTVR